MSEESEMQVCQDSFAIRVKAAFNGRFKPCMSRALFLVTLFEANRCLLPRYPGMRPFQRKIALLSTALDLIQTLDFLDENQKSALLTMGTNDESINRKWNKKPILARMAFRRAQCLDEEIASAILPGVEKLLGFGKSHEEICDQFVQEHYEKVTNKSDSCPPLWIFRRVPLFLVYRVYYRDMEVDHAIYDAVPPRVVEVPSEKPEDKLRYVLRNWSSMGESEHASKCDEDEDAEVGDDAAHKSVKFIDGIGENSAKNVSAINMSGMSGVNPNNDPKNRLQLLMEIKIRMDLLQEMEGTMPEKLMVRNKRTLFLALPPLVPAKEGESRHAHLMETKLRMDILRGMKGVLRRKRYVNEMKKMFVGMPPLAAGGVGGKRDFVEDVEGEEGRKICDEGEKESDGMEADNAWEKVDMVEDVGAGFLDIEIV